MTTIVYTGKTPPASTAQHIEIVHCPTIGTRLCADLHTQRRGLTIDHTQPLGVVIYSSTGIDALAEIADTLTLERCVFWCVGQKTQARLKARFPNAHTIVPETQNFAGLIEHLRQQDALPQTLLSIEMRDTPRALAQHLEHPNILTLKAYESRSCPQKKINAFHQSGRIDWVVITSPKGAKGFFDSLYKGCPQNFKIASIGPTTTAAIETIGYAIDHQPIHPNVESIIQHIAQVSTTV